MLWFLLGSLVVSTHALEAKVLLQSPTGEDFEFEAQLQAGGQHISPIEAYKSQNPPQAAREDLLALYAQAQKAFLAAEKTQAEERFRRVFQLWKTQDWKSEEQSLLLSSLLRLAQLSPENQNQWLKKALLLDVRLRPDPKLYPPPLLHNLHLMRGKRRLFLTFQAPWKEVLINGTACTSEACNISANLNEKVRATFLSNRFLPQTLFLKVSDIAKTNPPKKPWFDNPCEPLPEQTEQVLKGQKDLFPEPICEKAEVPLALQPRLATNPMPAADKNTSDERQFYQSYWFWSLTGVLLAAVSYEYTHHDRDRRPHTTYGF